MSILKKLKDIYRKYGMNSNSFYKISREEQEKYISLLGNPNDPILMSYNQYKCQVYVINKLFVIIMNLTSFIIMPFYLRKKLNKNITMEKKYEAVFVSSGVSLDIIPDSLLKKYKSWVTVDFGENTSLTKKDINFLKNKFSNKLYSPYFKFKIYIKMSMYSTIIKKYSPKAIISYVESSFTSQILTEWLENKGIKHINIMHGEKLYFIADSFAYFSEFFVWDEHYKNIFINLMANPDQFIIEKPKMLSKKLSNLGREKYFLTYYLSDENEDEIKNISSTLQYLYLKGMKCKIRLHPRGNNEKQVRKYLSNYYIENPKDIDLITSLENTKYICSLNSTVLYEGYLKEKEVIIDDISNSGKYQLLKELGYIMMYKEHRNLSEFIKE